MEEAKFVSSALHVVSSGIDITKDLESNQEKSISSLLDCAYEQKNTRIKKIQRTFALIW